MDDLEALNRRDEVEVAAKTYQPSDNNLTRKMAYPSKVVFIEMILDSGRRRTPRSN
jgi:hypothetical protein